MNNRIAYLVLFMIIAVVVVVVIYHSRVATDRMTRTATLQHVPEVLACQPLSTSEFDNRPTGTPCVTGRPCTYPDVVDLRVIAITFNRAESLSKLLRSLDPLVLDGDRAALEIWIDRDRNNGVDKRTMEVASEFSWKGGPTRVHVQNRSAGIMGQWIDTWRPRDNSDSELGLILEDDISVSPYAYRWLRAVHRAYRQRGDFVGTSLTSDEMSILSSSPKGPMAAPKTDTVLMYKCLGTWGFAPRPLYWRRFQEWFHRHKLSVAPHFRPYVPDALPTSWYQDFERSGTQDNMWEMWFIHFMHIEQVYVIYSNLGVYTGGKDNCLCINRREVGLHNSGKGREDLGRLMTVWKDEYVRFPANIVRLHWDGSPMGSRLY